MMERPCSGFAWLVCVFWLAACGDSGNSNTPATASKPATAAARPAAGVSAAAEDPASASAAVKRVLAGLREGRPAAVWEFLPPGYQRDVNELVHHLARTADPEIWQRTVAVLAKLADVLKTQRALLNQPEGAPAATEIDVPLAWLQSAEVLELLVASDLADPARAARLDVGEFLGGTGAELFHRMEQLSQVGANNLLRSQLSELSRIQVRQVKAQGDEATVELEIPGQPAEQVEFVRIEGRWIPRALADGWIEQIGRANAVVSTLSAENLGPTRAHVLALLDDLEKTLDRLGAAADRAQFLAELQAGAASVQKLAAAIHGPVEPEAVSSLPPGTQSVAIIVEGRLDEITRAQLLDRLGRAAFGTASSGTREYTATDAATIFRVSPVADVDSFAKSLDFIEVTKVDAATRRITAKLK
jgi:hypothetical protein